MVKTWTFLGVALLGSFPILVSGAAQAQLPQTVSVSAATCTAAYRTQWSGYFRLPTSDGRPGYKYYVLGVWALCRHDYAHAINMFKVAGSWGYKPAEYSLGIMYFRGSGTRVDRPLGAAWMALAAEQGPAPYAKVRDLMVGHLAGDELAQMEQWHDELAPAYGELGVRRAFRQWGLAYKAATGSHLGHPGGPLSIASIGDGGTLMFGGSMYPYYREFEESNNPYPMRDYLTGSVSVGSLEQMTGRANAESAKPGSHRQAEHADQRNRH